MGWKTLQPPDHLEEDYQQFYSLLHGKSPSNIRDRDVKGWGTHGNYTIKEGFKILKKLVKESNHNQLEKGMEL